MDAGKEGRPDGEHHRYHPEELLDVGDDRLVSEGRVEADLVEIHAGKVEPARSPYFLFTVNMVDISVRCFPDPLVADLYQIIAMTEGQDLLRADLYAGGWLAVFQPGVVAEDAFLDHRVECAGIAVSRAH